MKIVNREAFMLLPAGTVFSKYKPQIFGQLMIKDSTLEGGHDFYDQSIVDAVECSGSNDMSDKLFAAEDSGNDLTMDFEAGGRDGCFDMEQQFAVWDKADVTALVSRLQSALSEGYT